MVITLQNIGTLLRRMVNFVDKFVICQLADRLGEPYPQCA